MKAREIIYSAFRLLQVTGQGEDVSDESMESEALLALQLLVASWSARQILTFTTFQETFPLITGKGIYTIGINLDFDTISPEFIKNAYISLGNPARDKILKQISQEDYFSIPDKNFTLYPKFLYYEYGFNKGTIYLSPLPSLSTTLTISSYKNYQIVDDASIDTDINLPTPYLSALKYNLAVELASEYATNVPDSVVTLANQSLENIIKLSKKTVPLAKFDVGLYDSPHRNYNDSFFWWSTN